MGDLGQWLFGRVTFGESEEYLEFQYRFLVIVMVSGALLTLCFVVGDALRINPLDTPHVRSMTVFSAVALGTWLFLRGHKTRLRAAAWIYQVACLFEYVSCLLLVPQDELRMLWFLVNVPGVYILLGQRAGLVITLLTLTLLIGLNGFQAQPYSHNALATATLGIAYLALMFHAYGSRSVSFFQRLRHSNDRLRELASHDVLTGTLNARAYYALADRLAMLARRNGSPCAVLFIDLDHFKQINDNFGHAAGDLVLKSVARCLTEQLRQSDALGRIGGEEFSIFLPNTDESGALRVAENLRKSVEALSPALGEQRLRVTASIGVALSGHGPIDMADLQQQADQAMYRAKAAGRNRVTLFDAASMPAQGRLSGLAA